MRLFDRHVIACMCLVALAAIASAARAQRAGLTVQDVARIAEQALRVVVPPERALSGSTVASRQIAFDVDGTLSAFGLPPAADTAFHLERNVTMAASDALSDCSQMVPRPCAHLGRRAHVLITPITVGRTHLSVRVIVGWAARSASVPDSVSTGKGFLVGFAPKLYFVRRADGVWSFERQDRSVIAM
jgi:hypothetical protein